MKLFNNKPLYEAKIKGADEGMFAISLVDCPATESDFIYFSAESMIQSYSIQDEEKHIVFGLLMPADCPIYRRTAGGYEYYITHSPETLSIMVERYLKNGFSSNVDLNHDGNPVEGIDMIEIFAKNTERGIVPKGYEGYADGSIFCSFKVHNEEIWQSIKEGTFKGFSLAAMYSVEESFEKQENNYNTIMSKIERVKAMLRKMLAEFGEVSTDKGVLVWEGDEDLKEGDAVHGIDAEGNDVPAEDGLYETEDKKQIEVKDGLVVSIVDIVAEVAAEPEAETEVEAEAEPEAEENAAEEAEVEVETDERDARIAELEARVAELEAENAALKARIAELEAEPAAKSAEEEFESKVDENSQIAKMRKRGYVIG